MQEEQVFKIKPKTRFDRYEKNGVRFYYGTDKNGNVDVLNGITTILQEEMPTPLHLKLWQKGDVDGSKLAFAAQAGSKFHYVAYLYDLQDPERYWKWKAESYPEADLIQKEMVAWHNFRMKYPINFFLLEGTLAGEVETDNETPTKFATTLDRVGFAKYKQEVDIFVETGEVYKVNTKTAKAGDLKRDSEGNPLTRRETILEDRDEIWIIDLKSNSFDKEKDFYRPQLFQLLAQKIAFMQNYPAKIFKKKIRIFNWMPNAYKTDNGDNTYTLVEWVKATEEGGHDKVSWDVKFYTDKDIRLFNRYMANAEDSGSNRPTTKFREFHDFHLGYIGKTSTLWSAKEWAEAKLRPSVSAKTSKSSFRESNI